MAVEMPRRFESRGEADAWVAEHFGGWVEGLSSDERSALLEYKGVGYRDLNEELRGGDLSDWGRRQVAALDAAIGRAIVPEPLVAFRAVRDTGLSDEIDYLWGAEIPEPAYLSTALVVEMAESFFPEVEPGDYADHVLLEITVPAGASAAPLDLVREMGETELLLPRGTRLRVEDIVSAEDPWDHSLLIVRLIA
jgi:hypothetical protein